MKLPFEEENNSRKQECSALTSNLEGTALSCVMAKRSNERDSARKIFDIMLNRFGSGVQGHQDMVKFEKRRQRDDESIDKFFWTTFNYSEGEAIPMREYRSETWRLPRSSWME